MIDAHVHLEKGSYTVEWLQEFIRYATLRNIDEIFFLEHTHIFQECRLLYENMSQYNDYQNRWYEKKLRAARPLKEYIDFIESIKNKKFPVKLRFGLEVCYSPECEEEIGRIKSLYPFDFLAGSIHFIDGWAFSHLKQPWKKDDFDLSALYQRYYNLMYELAKSSLFSGLAHPNSLQCFGAYPIGDYTAAYDRIAAALKMNHMYVEESSGLAINYGDPEPGMNHCMLKAMVSHQVPILTASDAHVPEHVGKLVPKMCEIIGREKSGK